MATPIAEPSDLPAGSITDENARYFRVLVYQQDQEFAGIKTLGIGDWKTFLSYNGIAVDNVATFIGIDTTEYNYKSQTLQPLPAGMDSVVARIENLAANCGVTTQSGAMTSSLQEQINTLDGYVVDGWGEGASHKDGLLTRVQSNENDISDLQQAIGGGGGGGGTGLTNRVQTLETNTGVGEGSSYSGDPLVNRIDGLENKVGNADAGLVHDVDVLKTDVGDGSSGLKHDVNELKNEVETPSTGLLDRMSSLETTVTDNTIGLVKKVTDLQDEVETPSTGLLARTTTLETNTGAGTGYSGTPLTTRLDNIEQKISGVYTYKGNITRVVNNPPVTDTIYIDDTAKQFSTFGADENGYVYNINPSNPSDNSVTIYQNNQPCEYSRGSNIVWNWDSDSGTGYFDELGSVIDVSKISELDEEVTELQSKSITSENQSWTSRTLLGREGMYLVTATDGAQSAIDCFIGYLNRNGYFRTHVDIEVSHNFFVFSTSGEVTSTQTVFITQIGNSITN